VRLERRPEPYGRVLVTTRSVEAGALLLAEDPLLHWVEPDRASTTCAHCLRVGKTHRETSADCAEPGAVAAAGGWVECSGGCGAWWCSTMCEAADRGRPGGHTPSRCALLGGLLSYQAALGAGRPAAGAGGDCDGGGCVQPLLSYVVAALCLREADPSGAAVCCCCSLCPAPRSLSAALSRPCDSCCAAGWHRAHDRHSLRTPG
jgi:hypothetical protein